MKSKYKICYGIWGKKNELIYSSHSLMFPKNEQQKVYIEKIINKLKADKVEKHILYTKRFGHFLTNKGTEIIKEVDFILPYDKAYVISMVLKSLEL